MWAMMASLHALHRSGQHDLVGAKVSQFLKAIELSARSGGSWKFAWLLTDLPEPRPRHGGVSESLAHPAEFAASAAFLREQATLEAAAKRGGSSAAGEAQADGDKPWWQKLKDKKKADQEAKRAAALGGQQHGAANLPPHM